jgi:hypothetical protein
VIFVQDLLRGASIHGSSEISSHYGRVHGGAVDGAGVDIHREHTRVGLYPSVDEGSEHQEEPNRGEPG